MPRRTRKAVHAPTVQVPSEKESQILKLAQERLLERRQTLIPLQVLDDWSLSPFQGAEQLPRELLQHDLTQIVQQPRLRLRRWAAHCLEQLSLSEARFVVVDRRRWHDLQWYNTATAQLKWPRQPQTVLVNYSSAGFRIEPIINYPEDDEERWNSQRHLRFDQDGEWLWGPRGSLWQPYLAFLAPSRSKGRFR